MARTRLLKPEFFLDEEMARMSPLARLMFQALLPVVDREGRIEDRPARVKIQTLPYDDCDPERLLAELAAGGFIVRYEAGGRRVIQVRSFLKHQKPHHKEHHSVLPGQNPGIATAEPEHSPDSAAPRSGATVLDPVPVSVPVPVPVSPYSPPSGDGVGVASEPVKKARKPRRQPDADENLPPDFVTWWEAYPLKVGKLDALKAWETTARLRPPLSDMLATLDWQRESKKWRDDGGKYIKNPGPYLRAGMWADEKPWQPMSPAEKAREVQRLLDEAGKETSP